MCLVFDHGAKPFPGGDRSPGRREALAGEVFVLERGKQLTRFSTQPIVESQNLVESGGELGPAARIPARSSEDCLRVHVTLDRGQMANQVAQAEAARLGPPFHLVGGNARGNTAGSGAD